MKTKRITLLLLFSFVLCLFSCINSETVMNNCNENLEFRNSFMYNISKVEEYTSSGSERKDFDKGLKFLSNYVKVSYEEMMNYSNEYTNYNVFKKDKDNWLIWYEENKCNNIQFK